MPGRFLWLANADSPSTAPSRAQVSEGAVGTFAVREAYDGLVIITPTCDMQPRAKPRPFVIVAPLVRLPDDVDVDTAKAGFHIRYAYVPGAEGEAAFADLDRTQTVETGVIEASQRIPGLSTDAQRSDFAEAVGRKFSRFAFPDSLRKSIKKWRQKVLDTYGKPNSAEGKVFRAAKTIRVAAEPSWNASSIYVTIFVVMPDGWLPESSPEGSRTVGTVEELNRLSTSRLAERLQTETNDDIKLGLVEALQAGWSHICRPTDEIVDVTFELVGEGEFSYRDMADSESLDLDFVSGEADALDGEL